MYELPESYISAATAKGRKIALRVDLGEVRNGSYVDKASYKGGKGVIALKIVRGQTTGGFSLGGTVCATLTATFSSDVEINVKDRIQVYVGFGEPDSVQKWQGLGWFYVDTVKKGMYNKSVTACDAMLRFAKNYKSKLTYPVKVSDVLNEISEQTHINLSAGLEFFNDVQIEKIPEKGEDKDGNKQYYTRREILGYLAGINGGSAYIDVDFKINFAAPKETGYAISWKNTTSQSVDDTDFSVSHIVWNRSGITYSLGDDFEENTVEFTDPLAYTSSELILYGLETNLIGLSYNSITIKKQGTGMFQLGDLVDYEAVDGTIYKMLVMGIVYDFSGGFFSETLYSLAKSSSQQEFAGNKVIDQTEHIKETAGSGTGGVGKAAENDPTSEYFNDYEGNCVTGSYNHVEGKGNSCAGVTTHVEGQGNSVPSSGGGLHVEGIDNTVSGYGGVHVQGSGNMAKNCNAGAFVGGCNNTATNWVEASIIHGSRNKVNAVANSIISGSGNTFDNYVPENCIISGSQNTFSNSRPSSSILSGVNNSLEEINYGIAVGYDSTLKGNNSIFVGKNLNTYCDCGAVFGKDNTAKNGYANSAFMFGQGLTNGNTSHSFKTFMGEFNQNIYSIVTPYGRKYPSNTYDVLVELGNGKYGRNGAERSTGFVVDTAGRVFCNRVYQLDKININEDAENSLVLTGDFCLPCVRFIDHEPTTDDLTGEPCLFVQYGEKKINTGPTSIFEVKGLFVEKSVQ